MRIVLDRYLRYKGYFGTAQIDLEKKTLHGKVVYVNHYLEYKGRTLEDLIHSFHRTVDNHISTIKTDKDRPYLYLNLDNIRRVFVYNNEKRSQGFIDPNDLSYIFLPSKFGKQLEGNTKLVFQKELFNSNLAPISRIDKTMPILELTNVQQVHTVPPKLWVYRKALYLDIKWNDKIETYDTCTCDR